MLQVKISYFVQTVQMYTSAPENWFSQVHCSSQGLVHIITNAHTFCIAITWATETFGNNTAAYIKFKHVKHNISKSTLGICNALQNCPAIVYSPIHNFSNLVVARVQLH